MAGRHEGVRTSRSDSRRHLIIESRTFAVFSASLEIVLTIAYREAVVAAARVSDARAPAVRAGARSRKASASQGACGADLPPAAARAERLPRESVEQLRARPGARTGTDRGVPPRAADGGAARAERAARGSQRRRHPRGDPAAAEVSGGAPARRRKASPGSTSSNSSRTASRKRRAPTTRRRAAPARRPASATRARHASRDPLAAYCVNLTDRARAGPARSAHRPR